ncbi:hypothetical protein [Oscillibacter ruminantium]|uniref:hypothetical protein n=1 Tax=Oscillibacter ruminantium TaxID=1263547 RepID=UPI003331DCFD
MEGLEVKVAEIDQRSKYNTHRLTDLEEKYDVLNRLATAVEVLATKQSGLEKSVNGLVAKVDAIESKPAKRWDGLVDKMLFAAAGAFIAWIAAGMPGMK